MNVNWNAYVEDIGPSLFRYFCARFEKNAADDLVQETFLRVFRKLKEGRFSEEKGNLRQYSFGIALNIGREYRKSVRATTSLSDLQATNETKENFDLYNLKNALNVLNEIEREIIELTLDDQLTIEQMSKLLDIPTGTIKSHIHRAKQKLKEKLSPKESP